MCSDSYSSQCGHCKKIAPDWEQLAAEWEGHPIGLVAEIDCTDPDSKVICEDFEVTGYPTIYYGDPESPEVYDGARDYASMSAFAKEHLSKPICNTRQLDTCTEDQKQAISSVRAKSKSELEAIEIDVGRRVGDAEAEFDKEVEDINARYEAAVLAFNKNIDKIRAETNYKWVEQVLADLDEKDEL